MQLGDIVNLSNDKDRYYSTSAQVTSNRSTGSLYVIWHKSRGKYGSSENIIKDRANKSSEIVYRVSRDAGSTFSDALLLHSFKDVDSFGLPVAFTTPQHSSGFGEKVYLALVDKTSQKKYDVLLSSDSDDGNALRKPVLVSDRQSMMLRILLDITIASLLIADSKDD
jgi:hypothetical protein